MEEAKIVITLVTEFTGVHMSVDSELNQEQTIVALEQLTKLLKIGQQSCNPLVDDCLSLTS